MSQPPHLEGLNLEANLLSLLSQQHSDEDPVEAAISATRHAVSADLLVVLRTVDNNSVSCIHAHPADPICPLLTARSLCETALTTGRPEFIENYERNPHRSRLLSHWGARSAALIPILTKDLSAAVLLLWKKPVSFDDATRQVLLSLAAYLRAVLPHRETSNRLATAEARLSSILETIPQGVILIDSDTGEAWLNASAAATLHLSPGFCPPAEVSRAMTLLDRQAQRFDYRAVARPTLLGNTSEWLWSFGPGPDRVIEILTRTLKGSFSGQVWVLTDVTQAYRQSQELMTQSGAMQQVNRELLETKQELEKRVEERTAQLADAVTSLTENSAEQIRLQNELLRFNNDLQVSNHALRRGEEALRSSEERLLIALDATGLGVFETNLATREGQWDARCRAAFGIPPDMPINLDILFSTIHPEDRKRVERVLNIAIERPESGRYSVEYRTIGLSDGVLRYLRVEGRIQGQREALRLIGTIQDISVRKRAEVSLLRANNDLREFAYAAAHDLQEPLRNVANALGLLDRRTNGRLDSVSTSLVRESIASAQRMHDMVKDLLLFTRINDADSGTSTLTNSAEVLQRVTANLAQSIEEVHGRIEEFGLPEVRINPTHLLQLFQNLVGNALKYRRSDVPPVIQVRASCETGQWCFSVTDNGIGFDPSYAERIFGVFKRLHGRDEYPGNGIGLAICARIVGSYGGRIWAESQPGFGSTFFFTLPL